MAQKSGVWDPTVHVHGDEKASKDKGIFGIFKSFGHSNPTPMQKRVYEIAEGIPVPKWVEFNAYHDCFQCKSKFQPSHQHHCRICGQMFCSNCTEKLLLPERFDLKGKKGVARVCKGCVGKLETKAGSFRPTSPPIRPTSPSGIHVGSPGGGGGGVGGVGDSRESSGSFTMSTGSTILGSGSMAGGSIVGGGSPVGRMTSASVDNGPGGHGEILKHIQAHHKDKMQAEMMERLNRIYHSVDDFKVPTWTTVDKQTSCFHCNASFASISSHNCRLCGELFCPRCTDKFMLPSRFELKQHHKNAPARVCYGCELLAERRQQKRAGAEGGASSTATAASVSLAAPTPINAGAPALSSLFIPPPSPVQGMSASPHAGTVSTPSSSSASISTPVHASGTPTHPPHPRTASASPGGHERPGASVVVSPSVSPVKEDAALARPKRQLTKQEKMLGMSLNQALANEERKYIHDVKMYVPFWESLANYAECSKCLKKGGKGHNCRACGKLFCGNCTSKMELPEAFKRKNKPGPARVCDRCRFLIRGGAQLIPHPSPETLQREHQRGMSFYFSPDQRKDLFMEEDVPAWFKDVAKLAIARSPQPKRSGPVLNVRKSSKDPNSIASSLTVPGSPPPSMSTASSAASSPVMSPSVPLALTLAVPGSTPASGDGAAGAGANASANSADGDAPPMQLIQRIVSSVCAGCGSAFGLFTRRQRCFHCPDYWCRKCLKAHQDSVVERSELISKMAEAARELRVQKEKDAKRKVEEHLRRNSRLSVIHAAQGGVSPFASPGSTPGASPMAPPLPLSARPTPTVLSPRRSPMVGSRPAVSVETTAAASAHAQLSPRPTDDVPPPPPESPAHAQAHAQAHAAIPPPPGSSPPMSPTNAGVMPPALAEAIPPPPTSPIQGVTSITINVVSPEGTGASPLQGTDVASPGGPTSPMDALALPTDPNEPYSSPEDIDLSDPTSVFEFLDRLGEGSYGSVYKARDRRDNMICAVKVLEKKADDDHAELNREITFMSGCHSPYIVAFKGVFEMEESVWIAMEFCEAGSLTDIMEICERTLSEEQIAVVMHETLMGVEYLHSNRKWHRDIKAGNILTNTSGECKLADFGVSADLSPHQTRRHTMIGTPYWMAPEVLLCVGGVDKERGYDQKCDIWSLGITAFELAKGVPPHSDIQPMRAIFKIPNSPAPVLPDPTAWSPEFNDFLRVTLCKDVNKRPGAAELLLHPFIAKAGPRSIIAEFVTECMAEIQAFREREVRDVKAAMERAAQQATMTNTSGTGGSQSSGGSGGGGGNAGGDTPFGYPEVPGTLSDTMSGTMIAQGFDEVEDPDGTLVRRSSSPVPPDGSHAAISASNVAAALADDDDSDPTERASTPTPPAGGAAANDPNSPEKRGSYSFFLHGKWYKITQ